MVTPDFFCTRKPEDKIPKYILYGSNRQKDRRNFRRLVKAQSKTVSTITRECISASWTQAPRVCGSSCHLLTHKHLSTALLSRWPFFHSRVELLAKYC